MSESFHDASQWSAPNADWYDAMQGSAVDKRTAFDRWINEEGEGTCSRSLADEYWKILDEWKVYTVDHPDATFREFIYTVFPDEDDTSTNVASSDRS